jgi:hypothetical protein
MQFAEFAQKIEPYFDEAFIKDIQNQMPQGDRYVVWGWDVGDFSGDGYNDVAFAIKLASERKKKVQVYLFADIEGYMVKVGEYQYNFFEIPLEIGLVIKDGACYITKKNEQFDWLIKGYKFDNGSLMLLDEYHTQPKGRFTLEKYTNYVSLENTVKYLNRSTSENVFLADYLTIPSYPRGKQIYKGYNDIALSQRIDYVHKGAYNWEGAADCSFDIKSAYDDDNLYFTINVYDDSIVPKKCDSCECDLVEIWFYADKQMSDPNKFETESPDTLNLASIKNEGLFCFKIYPGNFEDIKSYIKLSTTDELANYQNVGVKEIKSVSSLFDEGYTIKVKIPFIVLGYQTLPVSEDDKSCINLSIVVHDIDNEFRPEEKTEIATSAFTPFNPFTYGCLKIVPGNTWYGDSYNIYKEDILKYLNEYGF